MTEETGYQWLQGTKPQTLAYGLTDSPVGLAAWIVEKFRSWSDCGGELEQCFTKDELLTAVMLYWATGAINSSYWPYYARRHGDWEAAGGPRIAVPTAYSEDRKSTRLNSSHLGISYAVFCLKKKTLDVRLRARQLR